MKPASSKKGSGAVGSGIGRGARIRISGSRGARGSTCGVGEGNRTPDLQNHNLAL